ncbi:Clavaminate synthase-like protein [Xylariaceae sp. FL1651]|nr:Clavaminate synthase-like protein [Xylariaceae sp. FL1651]
MAFVIPTIDVGPYLRDPASESAAKVVRLVREACVTSGFFQIVNHGIPKELQQAVFRASEALFSLPLEEKRKLRHPTLKNRGYELIGSQVLQEDSLPDLKEGFFIGRHISDEDERAKKHPYLIGPNIFPSSISDEVLKAPTETYYDRVLDLACKVLEILAKGLPYGDDIFGPFASNDPVCMIRLLHYPPQKSTDTRQLGAGAHTDFGAITLLMQDESGGLEVYDRTKDTWVAVKPNLDSYVVNIGDMLSIWTRNLYKSTLHRVINRSNRDRYSVPFFFDGNADIELAPLDGSKLVGGTVLTVEDHMLERYGTTFVRVEKATAT